jgi:predicted amidohydrolase
VSKRIRVAMGQILVEGGQPERNLRRAEQMTEAAARKGCDVIVLPECLDAGWTHPSTRQVAEPIPGLVADRLCRVASQYRIHLVAGITERAGDRIFNAAVLIDSSGEILLVYRKINVLDIAQDLYSIGDRLGVVETDLGTIGVNICADNFSESAALGHALARMGAQMILSPCAWAVPAEHDNDHEPYGGIWRNSYTNLARLYEMPMVGVSNVGWLDAGPWQGRKCIGCSLAVDGNGKVAAEASYGEAAEQLLTVELRLHARDVTGTNIAEALRRKGHRHESS